MSNITTAVIRTIGRKTLKESILSALTQKIPVIVVFDGCDITKPIHSGNITYIKTGRKWGHYGHMGVNLGAALATTEFITILDDDDTLGENYIKNLVSSVELNPSVDIWIPRLKYNNGLTLCFKELGVVPGNVAVPNYRTNIFYTIPFSLKLAKNNEYFDFFHVEECVNYGYKIDWNDKMEYLVRPRSNGLNGRGEL